MFIAARGNPRPPAVSDCPDSPFNFEGKRGLKPLGFKGGKKRLGLDKESSFEQNNLGVRTRGKTM